HSCEQLPERIDDRAELEVAGGHLVQHWGEEKEVVAGDERHLEVVTPGDDLLELEGGIDAAESTTEDEDATGRHHGTERRCLITSGVSRCDGSATVPSGRSSHASNPFTRTTRPEGGVVAARRMAR